MLNMKEILQKKSRDSSGYENLDSPAQVQFQLSNFNRCKLQSKLSYYEIQSGAKYLEQMGLWMNLSQIQSALIISERGGMYLTKYTHNVSTTFNLNLVLFLYSFNKPPSNFHFTYFDNSWLLMPFEFAAFSAGAWWYSHGGF